MESDKIKDIAYSIVKAGLGTVPLAGSAAVELFSQLVTLPLEKRRIEWMHDIGERQPILILRDYWQKMG